MKPSQYNIIVDDNGTHIVFNSKNCALVKVNDIFLDLLRFPDEVLNDEYAKLRQQMYDNGFLIDDDVDEVQILEYEHNLAKFNKSKLTLTILPTFDCNFKCFYCFENKTNECLRKESIKAIEKFTLEHIAGVKELYVCWFGGEPLLKPDVIWQLSNFFINFTEKNNIKYTAVMISNGSLFSDDIIMNMKNCKIKTVQITLDGSADFHNKRRVFKSGKPSFNIIVNNITKLINANIKVSCRINIDKTNFNSVKDLLVYLGSLKLDNYNVSFGQLLPLGSNDQWPTDICFNQEEFSKAVDILEKIARKNNISLPLDYPFYPRPSYNFCGACNINSFVIHPNGDVHKCYDCLDYKIGNIYQGVECSLLEKHNNAHWLNNSPFKDEECRTCKILPICMGSCPYLNEKMGYKFCLKWKNDIKEIIVKKYHNK